MALFVLCLDFSVLFCCSVLNTVQFEGIFCGVRAVKCRFFTTFRFIDLYFTLFLTCTPIGLICVFSPSKMQFGPVRLIVTYRKIWYWHYPAFFSTRLSRVDKQLLWDQRYYCRDFQFSLPKIMASAPSWNWGSMGEIHSLLHHWPPLSPVSALELLDSKYVSFPLPLCFMAHFLLSFSHFYHMTVLMFYFGLMIFLCLAFKL